MSFGQAFLAEEAGGGIPMAGGPEPHPLPFWLYEAFGFFPIWLWDLIVYVGVLYLVATQPVVGLLVVIALGLVKILDKMGPAKGAEQMASEILEAYRKLGRKRPSSYQAFHDLMWDEEDLKRRGVSRNAYYVAMWYAWNMLADEPGS
jgi:hypothetical protein